MMFTKAKIKGFSIFGVLLTTTYNFTKGMFYRYLLQLTLLYKKILSFIIPDIKELYQPKYFLKINLNHTAK